MGRELSHTRPAPQQGLQRLKSKVALAATESSCWQILTMVKGEIFFLNDPLNIFFPLELVLKNIHLDAFSATTCFKPEMSSFSQDLFSSKQRTVVA